MPSFKIKKIKQNYIFMKIGIYFETSENTGGAHHQNLRLLELFKESLSNSYEIVYIVSNKNQKKNS